MEVGEIVTISDSENEEEAKFLKIYYPSSSKCIEVPLNANDGSLLFADIKIMEPNIFALSLMKGETARLWKPTNGCFKEPKEKWSTFKVVAVLQDSSNASNSASSSTNNNVSSTRKLSIDSELSSVSTSTVAATNKESCSSIAKSGATEMPPSTSLTSSKAKSVVLQGSTDSSISTTTASMDKNVSSKKSLPDTSSDNQPLPSFSTIVTVAASINKESCASTSKSHVNKQRPKSATTAESATVKQNALSNSQRIDQSSPSTSLQLINASASNSIPSDAQIFEAFNVSSVHELKDLLCQRNRNYYTCFDIIFKYLKRTLLAHPDKDFVKLMYYSFMYHSNFPLKALNPSALNYCELCDRRFSVHHLVSREHIIRYQSKYKQDPPEISLILELKNRAYIISSWTLLMENDEDPYDYFINKFLPKADFDEFKGHFVYRIHAARLWIPFMDPLYFEKLLFLKNNLFINRNNHSYLKTIFPSNYRCNDCDSTLQGVNKVVYHLFTPNHLRKVLTQDEIYKLDQAVWYIDYSDDGFYYKTVSGNGKRNHEENLNVTKKRQRKS